MLVSTVFAQADPNVRRGYRLHVSNLEDRAFTFTVRYWMTPPTREPRWAAVLNQFFTLYAGLYGEGVENRVQAFARTGSVYVAAMTFVVEAKHTVPVGITPSLSVPRVEGLNLLEGYATLEVPVLRNGPGDAPFRAVPQSIDPVKVLLNPETTMVHTDTSGAGALRDMDGVVTGHISVTRLNFDTVESLIPASGKAENEVMPNGIRLLSHDELVQAVQASRSAETTSFAGTETLTAADRMAALIELLCELDSREAFLAKLNEVLTKNQSAARICREDGGTSKAHPKRPPK